MATSPLRSVYTRTASPFGKTPNGSPAVPVDPDIVASVVKSVVISVAVRPFTHLQP
jgi:hypothetical protein